MNNEHKFFALKEKNDNSIAYFDYDKIEGYALNAKKNLNIRDAINVNKIIIVNPSFIEKIASLKVNSLFKQLINLIMDIDDDDSDSGVKLNFALNQAERFKREVFNKYKKYLNEKEIEVIMKKITIIDDELRLRLFSVMNNRYHDYVEENGIKR